MIKELVQKVFSLFPIKKNRILFLSYYGQQYGCNPKYISQYLNSHYDDIETIWAFTNPNKYDIAGIKKVKYGSLSYYLTLYTSKIIITNYRMPLDFRKRKEQKYIQTWHSSLRLKQIEADAEATLPKHYVKMAKHDSRQTDYVVAGSQKSHETFSKAFWYNGKILDYGTPRNDIIIKQDQNDINQIKQQLGIKESTKILLYAPTFRNNNNTRYYDIDFQQLLNTLRQKYRGDWIILARLHPHLSNYSLFKNIPCLLDVTKYDDIQELLLISDMLISDYSSLIFDFALSQKPIILYTPDLNSYIDKERKLYFSFEELPFPNTNNNTELRDTIANFDNRVYDSNIKKFFKKVWSFEKGNASEEISKIIINIIKE